MLIFFGIAAPRKAALSIFLLQHRTRAAARGYTSADFFRPSPADPFLLGKEKKAVVPETGHVTLKAEKTRGTKTDTQHAPLRQSAEEKVRGKEREEGWGGENG